MKNYIFSTVAAACALELILEFAPFIRDATVKKYLRYIFALVISLCIIAPFSDTVSFGDTLSVPELNDGISFNSGAQYVYFEDDTVVCECSEYRVPECETAAVVDVYISECCFGIIRNSKLALSNKFSIETEDISIGISFDISDVSNIDMICAYINVDTASAYLKSDAIGYLETALGCRVYRMEVDK